MPVKVLITRTFKPDTVKQAYKLLMEMRSAATVQRGYLSGQTLVSADNPDKLLVISTWTNRKRWEDWKANDKRVEFNGKMETYTEGPESVEVFLTGEKAPEWVDMA
jgi:quinol monooxygenase YgiN